MDRRGIPEELADYIKEEAEKCGCVVVDIGSIGKNVLSIEVILDKKGGIALDECARFNKNVAFWIDGKGLFSGKYNLEVCSPGLDRVLKTDNDFVWAGNKGVRVTTREPVDGKNEIEGKLLGIRDNGNIAIEEDGGRIFEIERDKIAKARLRVEKIGK